VRIQPPDLHALVHRLGGYDRITPAAWEWWDRRSAECRNSIRGASHVAPPITRGVTPKGKMPLIARFARQDTLIAADRHFGPMIRRLAVSILFSWYHSRLDPTPAIFKLEPSSGKKLS
jgi:hypothetical protein